MALTADYAWIKDWGVLTVSALTLLSTTFQFYLRDVWAPQRKPTALDIAARLEQVGTRNGMILARLVLRATNPTDRRIYVPAFWFGVYGYALGATPRSEEIDWGHAIEAPNDDLYTRYNAPAEIALVAQRRIFADGSAWYDPKDVTVFEDVIAVPEGRFDYLKLYINYVHGRSLAMLDESEPVIWRESDGRWYVDLWFRGRKRPETEALDKESRDADVQLGKRWSEAAGGGLNVTETVLALSRPA